MSYNNTQSNYVRLSNGRFAHKAVVKKANTGLYQAGVQDTQYELDYDKIELVMKEFSQFPEGRDH